MLSNSPLGSNALGVSTYLLSDDNLNYGIIFVEQLDVTYHVVQYVDTAYIEIEPLEHDFQMYIHYDIDTGYIDLTEGYEVDIRVGIEATIGELVVEGFPCNIYYSFNEPTIEQYIAHLDENVRTPIYKIELLRKEDETTLQIIDRDIVNNSGSVTNTLQEGVRRTCSFTLMNIDNLYTDYISNLTIGDRFKVYLGYKIDGIDKFFPMGVYIFDDPSVVSNLSQYEIQVTGTDKWSLLNGQNGGILEGTYVVPMGSEIGDLVRSILRLNIVNDPMEPIIDSTVEHMTTTYDITKSAGETISDVLLEVALNISCYIYYDENGRLNIYPVEEDMYKSSAHDFTRDEYNYLNATKQYQLSAIYNSVLVIGENIQNTNTPIIYEAINNDLSDPNSVPNVGFKKVKLITDYTKGIDTEEKAIERANWELKKASAKNFNVDISCLSMYHLDVNQIVTLTDDNLDANKERYLINSIDIPIGTNIQSTINLAKAVNIE